LIAAFERESGVKVNYDVFDTMSFSRELSRMWTRFKTGH